MKEYAMSSLSFFFQAEDGIRDGRVTGVQTCLFRSVSVADDQTVKVWDAQTGQELHTFKGPVRSVAFSPDGRSEERRVGKEWRGRWWGGHWGKKVDVERGRGDVSDGAVEAVRVGGGQ